MIAANSLIPPDRERSASMWFWVAAAVTLVGDFVTKLVVTRSLPIGGRHVDILGDVFRFRHIRNSGGLFGLFPGNAIYFAAVSLVAVAVILWVVYRGRDRERVRVKLVALGLVLGGALGNLLDRLRYREVIDFVDVGIGSYRWPTFNVADSGVTIGVSMLVLWLVVSERRAAREVDDAGTTVDDEPEAADRQP